MNSFSFAVAICTYNPDAGLLGRLLRALHHFVGCSNVTEVIIVDNNSLPRVADFECVKHFLVTTPKARTVVEPSQGLSHARIRATMETKADIVVFFDDDNEPGHDYISILEEAFSSYPNSGAWGPGKIAVDFIDEISDDIRKHEEVFQKRDGAFGYVCTPGMWNEFCPFGTGLAVRREVLLQYTGAFTSGKLTRSDRSGASLASAGDVQIIWECFKLGMSAGVLADLSCVHMINAKKANKEYMTKLSFWTASSYLPALRESFPLQKIQNPGRFNSIKLLGWLLARLLCQCIILWLKNMVSPRHSLRRNLAFASYAGGLHGELVASKHVIADRFLMISGFFGVSR